MQLAPQQTKLQFLTKLIGLPQLVILFLLLIILIFYSTSTKYVPSWKMINVTDANNQTVSVIGVYSYAQKNYVIKARDFEIENSQIPKSDFPLEGALLIYILIIIIVFLYLRKKDFNQVLTKEQIEKIGKQYLERMKKEEVILSYDCIMGAKLSEKRVDNGEVVYNHWNWFVDVTDKTGVYEHRLLVFHPYTGMLLWDLNFGKEIMAEDTCPKCGSSRLSDMRIITPEGYAIWKEKFGQKVYTG